MVRLWAIVGLAAVLLSATDADARRRRRRGKRGALALTCSVAGAKVMVDGKIVGKTPIKQQALSGGAHTVTVKKLGFLDFSEKVQIRPGKTVRLFADLLAFAGVIKVTANVARARVTIDGKEVGKAPLERELKLGQHTVVVVAPGYQPHTETVVADPGKRHVIKADLSKAGDELALTPLPSDDDPLALEPLDGGTDDTLDLTPLPKEEGDDDDVLALAALTPPPGINQTAAVDPTLGTGDPELAAELEPPGPWYLEWWAITGTVAVIAGAVVTTVVLTNNQGEPDARCIDTFAPGDFFDPCPE